MIKQYNEKFLALLEAVKSTPTKYPQLRVACLAQSIMESGWADTKLAKEHNNYWGMKYRKEMEGYATSVYYETNTEPTGGADFCKFSTPEAAVRGYWQFLTRSPYKGWEQYSGTPEDFLAFIGDIWCPPGYTSEWAKKHGGKNYHEYIITKFFPVVRELLASF